LHIVINIDINAFVTSQNLSANMSDVTEILGDLTKLPSILNVTHIVHQLNCLTIGTKGLARTIAEKYPWANVYARRKRMQRRYNVATPGTRGVPGEIVIDSVPDAPAVVGFFAQWDYGRASNHRDGRPSVYPSYCQFDDGDSNRNRIVWFKKCLKALAVHLQDVVHPKVAFPHEIGCGLAQGNWDVYRQMIEEWSAEHQIPTLIVRWFKKPKKAIVKGISSFFKHRGGVKKAKHRFSQIRPTPKKRT
jgi:O-acetyl-ADP-ribose deacetylase (regulator of RNase III)